MTSAEKITLFIVSGFQSAEAPFMDAGVYLRYESLPAVGFEIEYSENNIFREEIEYMDARIRNVDAQFCVKVSFWSEELYAMWLVQIQVIFKFVMLPILKKVY